MAEKARARGNDSRPHMCVAPNSHTLNLQNCELNLCTRRMDSVTHDDAELMAVSKRLVCKSTEAAVPDSAVAIRKTDSGDQHIWEFTVTRANVSACGSIVFDPRMTPMGTDMLIKGSSTSSSSSSSFSSSTSSSSSSFSSFSANFFSALVVPAIVTFVFAIS